MNRLKKILACSFLLLFLITSTITISAATDENTLRLGTTKDEFKLMNLLDAEWYDANFFGLTNVGLISYSSNLSIAPCLAKDWITAPDGKSIKFNLVRNAKWHDGMPVTAEDVAFTFEYLKNQKLKAEGYWFKDYLDRVDILDNYSVNVVFKEPTAATALTYLHVCVLPKHIWEKIDDPMKYESNDSMIGCGPFVFDKYDKDAQIIYLKANSNYFIGKTSVENIELHYYRTLDMLLLALKKGDIDAKLDYYNPVPGVYAADLIKSNNIDLGVVPDVGVPLHLAFGFRKYPTNVTEFRQAISYAIDYQALVDMIAAGYGQVPSKGYLPPTVAGYNSSLPKLETNLTKSKEILDRAGFFDVDGDGFRESPNGSKLRLPITPNVKQSYTIRAAEVIKTQLNKIGLDTYVELLSNEDVGKKINTDRDYYMVIGYSTPFANMMAESGSTYFADMPGLYGTSNDPDLIALVKEIQHSRNVEDLNQRRSNLQEYIAEEQPIIALVWGDAIYPYRTDRWNGWVPMYGYGPVNYLSWFELHQSNE